MRALGVTRAASSTSGRRRRRCWPTSATRSRGRAGLRHHVRERAGRAAHRLPVPAGQPSRRHRDRHRRSVGAGAGLVHLWRRRPDGALQRQCRRAEDADPASDPLDHRPRRSSTADVLADAGRDPGHGDLARAGPGRREGETPQSTEAKIGPYALQDFTLFYTLRYGFAAVEDRLPGAARLGGCGARRLAAAFPAGSRAWRTTCRRSATGWRCSCAGSSRSASSSAVAMPNGPKVSAGGSLSPRGDWRAPSDGNAAAWLAELERNVPEE